MLYKIRYLLKGLYPEQSLWIDLHWGPQIIYPSWKDSEGISSQSCSNIFKEHIKVLTGENPLVEVSKVDQISEETMIYQSIHLDPSQGQKPFACSECEYKLSYSGILKEPIKVHTGKKFII